MHKRHCIRLLIGFVLLLVFAIPFRFEVSVFSGSGSIGIRLPQGLQHKNDSEHAHQMVNKSCKSLLLHEEGRWEHQYAPLESNHNLSVILSNTYHPIEIDWIMTNTTSNSNSSSRAKCDRDNDGGLMYVSQIGHQCGCGLPEFHPSISQWISDSGNTTQPAANISIEHPDPDISSPSLRLTLELAKGNRSLCFVGDSIDLQFFDALKHNLRRQKYLQNQINISISTNYSIPVDYTNDTGFPPHRGQMIMNEIKEMKVSFRYVADDDYYSDAHTNTATVRYYKMYGWSPWTTSFLDDCNIVIMNLGLHYNARGAMKGIRKWNLSYKDDVKAAMIYLADFASWGRDRISVWRSVLPQHFNTTDGIHERNANLQCSLEQRRPSWRGQESQPFNHVTQSIFSQNCNMIARVDSSSCGRHHREYDCTVNRTSEEYLTVYKYYLENNITARLRRFQESEDYIITGRILHWSIADIFDVPEWHVNHGDCSHFCYVPPLYEAAFERLLLLLPPLHDGYSAR